MRQKIFRLTGVLFLFILLGLAGCNKLPVPVQSVITNMRNLVVGSTFNWKTTKPVTVNVTVPTWDTYQTLKIYSIDNQHLYYAGFPGASGHINANITVPAATNMLKLVYGQGNQFKSILAGIDNQLTYNYNSFKSLADDGCDLSGEITYSQGSWSAKAHGNNLGTIRDKHFNDVFPSGLVVGDPSYYTIRLTSSSDVRNFLPGGGKSKVLTQSYTNPNSRNKVAGKWGGQIAAAILNVEFNKAGYLGSNPIKIGDLIFKKGAFKDMSVNAFLKIANTAIGDGGLGGYSIENIQNAAELINLNFDRRDLGYFTCPAVSGSTQCGNKGGLGTLTMKFNGSSPATIVVKGEKSGDILYNSTVQPGATFTFQGKSSDGKLDKSVDFYVNGTKNTTIHTSGSVNLYRGDVYGSFTIMDGTSDGGIHLCAKTPTTDCGCNTQLYSLKLRYDGNSEVEVKVKERKHHKQIYIGEVKPEGEFSFNGSHADGKIYSTIYIYEDGSKDATIYTRCSRKPEVGKKYGDFTIVAGTSKGNKALCGSTTGGGTTPPGGSGTTPPSIGSTTSNYNGTLAFEDLWPYMGDYDFNDVVVGYAFATTTDAQNRVQTISATFILQAFGASYHDGFGFQLPNVMPNQVISVTGSNLATDSYIKLSPSGLEAGQSKATVIVFDDAWRLMAYPGIGIGVNTNMSAPFVAPDTLVINMTFFNHGSFAPGGSITYNQLDIGNFNPFIIVNKDRKVEIHLPDHAPTDLADKSLLGTGDDASNAATGTYYKTANNLPWAINIPQAFDYPIEKQDIIGAYLHFAQWAESNGTLFPDWYMDKPGYRDVHLIYKPH